MVSTGGALLPTVIFILIINLAASSQAFQSSHLSHSHQGLDQSPVLLLLNNAGPSRDHSSKKYDTALELNLEDKSAAPLIHLLKHLAQSSYKTSASHNQYRNSLKYNDRKQRFNNRLNNRFRYRSVGENRYNRDRNFYDVTGYRDYRQKARYQRGKDRLNFYNYRNTDRYHKPLRSDVKDQENVDDDKKDRRDHDQDDRDRRERDRGDRDRRVRDQDDRDRRDREQDDRDRRDRPRDDNDRKDRDQDIKDRRNRDQDERDRRDRDQDERDRRDRSRDYKDREDRDQDDRDRRDRDQDDRDRRDRDRNDRDRRDRDQDERDRRDRDQDDRDRRDSDEDERDRADRYKNHDQDRRDKQRYKKGSAQAQIPVLRSILRNLNCKAKMECQDSCTMLRSAPEKDECEDICETNYDCEDEEDDNDSCDSGTTAKTVTQGGSTKGPRLETAPSRCRSC